MADMIFKTYRAEVRGVDENEGTIDLFIPVSTDSVDREGEIIEPTAFRKTLPKFMKRPVLVASHDYRDLTNQIGEWSRLKIGDTGLDGKPKYYVNAGNEQADWGFYLASKGMAAFSIGFIPKAWEDGDGVKSPRRTYKEVELLEISQVIVPSNREAIQAIRSKGIDPITDKLMDDILSDENMLDIANAEKAMEIPRNQWKRYEDIRNDRGLITKPEETDEYIRIPVKECKITATIDISKDEGIKALYCGKEKEIATYLFAKEKGWTMAKARAWIKEHAKEYVIAEATTTENEDINIIVVKIPDTPQIYKEKKTSQEQIIDEIDYLKSLIEKEGLSEEAKTSAIELIKIMCSDDLIRELAKRLPANDIAVKDNFTNQDILESLKRISNIGGK